MAPGYDRSISWFERLLLRGGREWVCSRATGDTLEIAIGSGRNLRHYPEGVALTGIELSPEMLKLAQARADQLRRPARIQEANAQRLPFADSSFDTVVCTLALCSIPDDGAAVREAFRVLRPSGRFLLLEHVGSPSRSVHAVQWLLDQVSGRLGDHLLREPLVHLRAAGFEIGRVERLKLGIVERVAARKPA